jgi:hypothetical protein
MQASPPYDAAISDTSLTRAGSASALNADARCPAAAVVKTPPVSGAPQADTSAVALSDALKVTRDQRLHQHPGFRRQLGGHPVLIGPINVSPSRSPAAQQNGPESCC